VVRLLRRALNPLVYLKAVMGLALLGLVILPAGMDMVAAASKPVASGGGDCRIVSVLDGDTLTLACAAGRIVRARLLGLDAPEKYSPACATELAAAERATWALRMLILDAQALSLTEEGVDRYGRVLVRLTLDGADVALTMIRAGHARAYGGGPRGSWC
jgi:endonuclease YncB( thermonuclease family)